MTEKYTVKQVIDAITEAKGIVKVAADSLGCTRQTVGLYIRRHVTVKAAVDEAREAAIDHVESKLMSRIDAGDTTAMIFFLKTQGRSRGYVERQEISGPNGKPVQMAHSVKPDLSKLSVAELRSMREMVAKVTNADTES